MIEAQQGLSYGDQLALARRAEDDGYEAFFRSDHYQSFPGPAGERTTDAWAVLAGLARDTSRIGLGALVSPVTFRHAGNFAKVATTVDEMSSGRIEVALGAGWNEIEHTQLGLPFPPITERADLLEENLAVLHGLWGEPDGWSFEGKHVRVQNAQFHPKPVDAAGRPRLPNGAPRPRIIVGGEGSPRSMRIAARYADEFNLSSSSPQTATEKFANLSAACRKIGRDDELTRSAMVGVLVGRHAEEVARRRADLLGAFGIDAGDEWFATRAERWILGTPDQARAMVDRFAEAGVERIMLQDFLPHDLDMVDLLAETLF
jgi:F420-dependent oxidoreductase-like protein